MKPEKKQNQQQSLYHYLSYLLDYPTPTLVEQTSQCIDLLKMDYSATVEPMTNFLSWLKKTESLGHLEEVYTGTFDINPACHIFAGHILFGESFQRGAFLAGLTEEYQQRGFDSEKELADHIPLVLRFLATLEPQDAFAKELLTDCLIPVFQKMNANFEDDSTNPYVPVLRTALLVLEGTV